MAEPEVLVSKTALIHNLKLLQQHAQARALFPVLKANAYGHGISLVAPFLETQLGPEQCPYFCVARVSEARELRAIGVKRPVLVLSFFSLSDFHSAEGFPSDTALVINSLSEMAELLSLSAAQLRCLNGIHLNFNTGMNRLGFSYKNFPEFCGELMSLVSQLHLQGVVVRGLMTHFASAEIDIDSNNFQKQRFHHIVSELRSVWKDAQHGSFPRWLHIENSAALCQNFGLQSATAARPGLHLWGYSLWKKSLGFKPALSVRAPLRQIFSVAKGDAVGYGLPYLCSRESLVGTVPLGYADGVSRRLSRAEVGDSFSGFVVNGVRVPTIGKVSMDLCVIDLTDHPEAPSLRKGAAHATTAYWICPQQTADDLAQSLNTISYEILCRLDHRLPRRWKEESKL